ncbi:MAG: mechanosensitive ion channel, partial [Phycisphaerales bacterium]
MITILVSVAAVIGCILGSSITRRLVTRFASARGIGDTRSLPIKKVFGLLWLFLFLIVLGFIWGFNFRELYVASAGIFALVGIAFFAVWSILSNITTSIIIFFKFPMKVGDTLRLPEAD